MSDTMSSRLKQCLDAISAATSNPQCNGKQTLNVQKYFNDIKFQLITDSINSPIFEEFDSKEDLKQKIKIAIDENDPKRLIGFFQRFKSFLTLKICDGKTPMHYAAEGNSREALMCIIIASVNQVDILNQELETPIFNALRANKIGNFVCLYTSGADIHRRNSSGMNLISVAASICNTKMLKILIDLKVSIENQDSGGWSCLMWSVDCIQNNECANILLNAGSDPNVIDHEGNNILHWLVYSGNFEIFSLVILKMKNLDAQNIHGDTALHLAAKQNEKEMIEILLSAGANASIRNNYQQTPLNLSKSKKIKQLMEMKMNLKIKFHYYSSDISDGRENVCVPAVNEIDEETLPSFTYVTKSFENFGAIVNRQLCSFEGCSCVGDCSYHPDCSCRCLSENGQMWYKQGVCSVDSIIGYDRPLIFECNPKCKCSMRCSNRLVQFGTKLPLEVFKTDGKGWGARTLKPILKGTYISQYTGEIITDLQADARVDNDSYLFDLDMKEVSNHSKCIDALYYGNVTRFFNHCCNPNMLCIRVFYDHHDIEVPTIAFFASRDIKEFEELSFDYGDKFWNVKKMSCNCGSVKCKYSKVQTNSNSSSTR